MLIEGQVETELTVNGEVLPIGPSSLISLSVIQSTNQMLPTLELEFYDVVRLFSRGVFTDGSEITVKINPQFGDYSVEEMKFRMFNVPTVMPSAFGHRIQISAYLDYVKMFREVVSEPIEGPSSKVIQNLAAKIGVKADVDVTNDSMKWLPNNKPIGQFMRHAMDHSYAGMGKAMQLAFTGAGDGQWEIRYKDPLTQLQSDATYTLRTEGLSQNISDPTIEFYRASIYSGILNSLLGYSSEIIQPTLAGNLGMFKDVSFVKAVQNIAMNTSLNELFKTAGTFTRRELHPADMGNTHEKYAEAKNNNQRLKSTISAHLHVLTRHYTRAKLLDPINVLIASGPNAELDEFLCGKYLLLGRTQYVRGAFYRERLHLASQGMGS